MEIENYVMENIVKKIVCSDNRGNQYIHEEDIDKFDLTDDEKEFIIKILPKYEIEYEKSYAKLLKSSLNRERFNKEVNEIQKQMETDPAFRRRTFLENAEREGYTKQLIKQNNRLWR